VHRRRGTGTARIDQAAKLAELAAQSIEFPPGSPTRTLAPFASQRVDFFAQRLQPLANDAAVVVLRVHPRPFPI
jgi:hypothetical protein